MRFKIDLNQIYSLQPPTAAAELQIIELQYFTNSIIG